MILRTELVRLLRGTFDTYALLRCKGLREQAEAFYKVATKANMTAAQPMTQRQAETAQEDLDRIYRKAIEEHMYDCKEGYCYLREDILTKRP